MRAPRYALIALGIGISGCGMLPSQQYASQRHPPCSHTFKLERDSTLVALIQQLPHGTRAHHSGARVRYHMSSDLAKRPPVPYELGEPYAVEITIRNIIYTKKPHPDGDHLYLEAVFDNRMTNTKTMMPFCAALNGGRSASLMDELRYDLAVRAAVEWLRYNLRIKMQFPPFEKKPIEVPPPNPGNEIA